MSKTMIVYETRSGNTEKMAEAIAEGMKDMNVEVELKRVASSKADDFQGADAVILGSPTYHHDLVGTMKTFLFEMEKADLKGKIGAAFGSYGWSGESVGMMTDTMKHIFEMNVIEPGLKIKRRPTEKGLEECKGFGKRIAEKIK